MAHQDRSDLYVDKQSIGSDGGILLTIENAMLDANAYRDTALQSMFVKAGAVYPGLRSPVPYRYEQEFADRIAPLIQDAFGGPLEGEIESCAFSLVTIPPDQLAVNQRTPHTDANASHSLAFIHYLCDPAHGGTSFYRHRKTGFERITDDRAPDYNRIVAQELSQRNQASASDYVTGSDDHFERILVAENRFNRMLVYFGNSLHSGDIKMPDKLSSSPKDGRLTVTGFLQLRTEKRG